MSKPVSLTTANVMNELATLHAISGAPVEAVNLAALISVARHLLCQIAHTAAEPVILKALAAIGAPATPEELRQAIYSARDAMRHEAGAPSAAPSPAKTEPAP